MYSLLFFCLFFIFKKLKTQLVEYILLLYPTLFQLFRYYLSKTLNLIPTFNIVKINYKKAISSSSLFSSLLPSYPPNNCFCFRMLYYIFRFLMIFIVAIFNDSTWYCRYKFFVKRKWMNKKCSIPFSLES